MPGDRKRAYASSLEHLLVVETDRKGRIQDLQIELQENIGDNFCQIPFPKGNFTFLLKYSKVSR
jgi:hypothetical protein